MIKKIVLMGALIGALTAAQAVEIGITDGNNFTKNENVWGLTVGTQVKGFNVTGGFARSKTSDTYSVVGAKDVAKFGPASVAAKAGGAYTDIKGISTGYAAIVGVGATVPLAKKVSATLDYSYYAGQNKVSAQDGNRLTAGLKYSF